MLTLPLPDYIVTGLRDGRITRIVLPFEKQPPSVEAVQAKSGAEYNWMECTDWNRPGVFRPVGPIWAVRECGWPRDENCKADVPATITAPYAPGDIVGVKEACWIDKPFHAPGGLSIVYAADVQEPPRNTNPPFDNWVRYSASRMPLEFVRTRIAIVTVDAKRVQGITEPEAQQCGWDMSNLDMDMTYDPVTMDKAIQWLAADWDSRYSALPWALNPWLWSFGVRLETR